MRITARPLLWATGVLSRVGGALPTSTTTNAAVACDKSSVGSLLWLPAMNVFRRISGDIAPVYRFYTDTLGFEGLTTYDVGNDSQVWRIKAGSSELKLSRQEEGGTYVHGGAADATGLRLWTFFSNDETGLVMRFRGTGRALPKFKDYVSQAGQLLKRSALVADPDGHAVELVITNDPPGKKRDGMEVGMVVSNFNNSLPFYHEFVGLEQLESEFDPVFNTTKHLFRQGSTVVSLRSFGAEVPADTGSAGIQYVVSDLGRVDELARCRNISINKPLSGIPGFDVRTLWLDDPDGIINYFAETADSRRRKISRGKRRSEEDP